MQVYPNRLAQTLQNALPRFIMVFGDEPQQKLDAIEQVRAQAKQQGFDERQSLVADTQFEWYSLIEASQNMSLFSSRQYIELEIPTGKPGTEGSKTLLDLAAQDNPDVMVLIHGAKIGKEVTNSKWFKQLDQQGIYIPCYPLEGDRLRSWIMDEMRQLSLQTNPAVVNFFIDYFEGNLLAAKQELQKLALLYPDGNIDIKQIEKILVEQSRFNVFQLADVLLAGDASKAVKLLNRLESEGIEPNIVLWALVREWQTLSTLQFAQSQRQPLDKLWAQLRIWQNRKSLYMNALNRLGKPQLDELQHKLQQLDMGLKQSQITRPYVELCHLCLMFMPMQLSNLPMDFS
ncbi:DNA polymerase III subunit delta [Paraneptunicella aestuarii]|uniref:DNA polymerase III subunit delta n=1 Tax=Paraneptunicella aestuarii TaxID=2831148 RepID=UPI001E41582C|nr:DNA polymerase III subunit delta [Paraneptunicella aestuarii]UAA39942.1 DNA polymerase III subunit delta [Paraneptunicella aestuarii]